ncbi:MAG: YjbF family lipoprotein [Chloroflexi bacterium]|nr:YjbF family lipoprotein [Chloroflexota bacterium]
MEWPTSACEFNQLGQEIQNYDLLDYAFDGSTGRVWASEPKESVIIEDLIFHSTHGSRHMGMMEALYKILKGLSLHS